jgi:hypothetical protein
MADDNNNQANGPIGLIVGGMVVLAAVIFILTGGELGGVKQVTSDADLPPVASPEKK